MSVDFDLVNELWNEVIVADGFDDAIIGIKDDTGVVYYSKEKVINILIRDHNMTDIEAMEYADFNVFGAYIGDKTPIFLDDFFINT
tara:strand:+ start:424 stop:681 length:258 start_codon:yes stop_codon:yes gene_type:complete